MDGVCYMLVGGKHAVQLAVSVHSLRRHWDGPVTLIAGDDEGESYCRRIAADSRLQPLEVIRWDAPTGGGKGRQHANKSYLPGLTPFKRTVFLDADTLVVGDILPLFPTPGEVRLTAFNRWKTNERPVCNRIRDWLAAAPREVPRMLENPYPAINTGTFGLTRDSTEFCARWRELCDARPKFMCDELVAQIIFPDFPHTILDCRWNASPVFMPTLNDVRIWHGHGSKFIRRETGLAIWWPAYQAAIAANIASLPEWTPARDRALKSRLHTVQTADVES